MLVRHDHRRRPVMGALVALLAFAACTHGQTKAQPDTTTQSRPGSDRQQPQGRADWPGFNGGYDATRYSPLDQVTAANAAQLREVARFQSPEVNSFQCGPVVMDGIMYITTASSTYAIDAVSAKLRWSRDHKPISQGLGTPVRGVAYADGRIFRGTPDGRILCMDATGGSVVWEIQGADASKGEYFTVAPVAWQGRVYIGNSGSDVGAIGHVRAFDAATGERIWNFDIVPQTGPGAETWELPPGGVRAGGGMYSSFALDPDTGALYVPTGNPGPDFLRDYRRGDNLYTCSVIKLDARTGKLLGYHQFVPNDYHDWDIAASPALLTTRAGRRMVAVAGKNGYLYGLSPDLKDVHFRVAITGMENTDAPLTAEGTRFKPGTQGGTNWYGPTYSPRDNAIYAPAIDWATTLRLAPPEELVYEPGKPFLGSENSFGDQDPDDQKKGQVTAVDADSGEVLWQYVADTPMVAAVTPTAGGVVLTGDTQGNFLAFDSRSGEVLLKKNLGDPIGGGTVTYMVNGKQYIAVPGGMNNKIVQTKSGPAWVAILALPD